MRIGKTEIKNCDREKLAGIKVGSKLNFTEHPNAYSTKPVYSYVNVYEHD